VIVRVFRAMAKDGKGDDLVRHVEKNNIPYVERQVGLRGRVTGRGLGTKAAPHPTLAEPNEILMFSAWNTADEMNAMKGSDETRQTAEFMGQTFHYNYETFGPLHDDSAAPVNGDLIVRVFRAKAKDGKIDELVRLVEKNNIPFVERQVGLRGRFTGRGQGEFADEILMMSIFDSLDSLNNMKGTDQTRQTAEFMGQTFHYNYRTFGPLHRAGPKR
jgi:hypothetical protein